MEKTTQLFNPDELVCSVCGNEVDIAHIDLSDKKHQDTKVCAAFEVYREHGHDYIVECTIYDFFGNPSYSHGTQYKVTGIVTDAHTGAQNYEFIGDDGNKTSQSVHDFLLVDHVDEEKFQRLVREDAIRLGLLSPHNNQNGLEDYKS